MSVLPIQSTNDVPKNKGSYYNIMSSKANNVFTLYSYDSYNFWLLLILIKKNTKTNYNYNNSS